MAVNPISGLSGMGLSETQGIARANQMLSPSLPQTKSGTAAFSDLLSDAINGVHQAQQQSSQMQQAYQLGDPNTSLEGTMIAMNEASLSFQMLAQTRNKVVAAYSEVMNMTI